MKIAIVSKDFPPNILGGGEISAYNLAQALSELGLDVHVITTTHIEPLEKSKFILHPIIRDVQLPGVLHYLRRNEVFYRESYKAVSKFLAENRDTDVVHAMNMASIPGTVKAAVKHRVPSVITINSHWLTCPTGTMLKPDGTICDGNCSIMKTFQCYSHSPLSKMALGTLYSPLQRSTRKKYASKADAVVSISKSIEEYVKQVINPKRSFVIPNIINADEYNVAPEEEYQSTLLFVGALIKPKGCEYLIRAMPDIVNEHPDAVLRILGDGAERAHLRELSAQLEIEKNVRFEGAVPHEKVPLYYASTDIVVLPSTWPEPLSRIILEAMASGKPIVATKAGGTPDVIKQGENGILVDISNSKQIYEAILSLLSDESKRVDIGKKGKGTVEKMFGPSAVSKSYHTIYKEIST